MIYKESNWANYYAIFLVKKEGNEQTTELIASAMIEEMSVDFAKYLVRKYEKKSDVVGLYVRKLFGSIVYAHTKPVTQQKKKTSKKKTSKKRSKKKIIKKP